MFSCWLRGGGGPQPLDPLPSNLPQGETQIALRPEEHSGGCRPSFPRGLFSPTRSVATQMLISSALDGAKLQHPSACQADHLRFTPRQEKLSDTGSGENLTHRIVHSLDAATLQRIRLTRESRPAQNISSAVVQ